MRAFFYHYNKPASMAAGRVVLTVHWKGACHLVNYVDCYVRTKNRDRKTQPRCVIAGKAFALVIATDSKGIRTAHLTDKWYDFQADEGEIFVRI